MKKSCRRWYTKAWSLDDCNMLQQYIDHILGLVKKYLLNWALWIHKNRWNKEKLKSTLFSLNSDLKENKLDMLFPFFKREINNILGMCYLYEMTNFKLFIYFC